MIFPKDIGHPVITKYIVILLFLWTGSFYFLITYITVYNNFLMTYYPQKSYMPLALSTCFKIFDLQICLFFLLKQYYKGSTKDILVWASIWTITQPIRINDLYKEAFKRVHDTIRFQRLHPFHSHVERLNIRMKSRTSSIL